MHNNKNHFELFSLPVKFDVDLTDLNTRFRHLQKIAHPDKYASGIEQERLQSVQQASQINDAYNTIKNPVERAKYILQLNGFEDDKKSVLEPAFLMAKIELHEQIEEAQGRNDIDSLDKISGQIATLTQNTISAISELFSADSLQNDKIIKRVQEAQFFVRLQENIDSIILDIENND